MDGLLHPGNMQGLSAVNNWPICAQPAGRIIEDNYGHSMDTASRLTATAEENVRA